MESTASMNLGRTHQIDSKTRVMADAWTYQKHYVYIDP